VTIVFVHGNPETVAVWDSLVEAIGRRDVIRLSPPGFGTPLPENWPGTFLDYRDWLEGNLAEIPYPIDLVGHDWGGGHVLNAVMHRPELVRSWVSDAVGLFDADYVFHDMAQKFQTVGDGERLIDSLVGGPLQTRVDLLTGLGVAPNFATDMAAAFDREMGSAILLLYRSARQPAMADAGRQLERAGARPGLAILATEDSAVGSEQQSRRAAERAGARTEVLEGLGHWWMLQDPERSAAALARFWRSLD
jgi:pimeloyl-ACP methyl ester carboxylesterase